MTKIEKGHPPLSNRGLLIPGGHYWPPKMDEHGWCDTTNGQIVSKLVVHINISNKFMNIMNTGTDVAPKAAGYD